MNASRKCNTCIDNNVTTTKKVGRPIKFVRRNIKVVNIKYPLALVRQVQTSYLTEKLLRPSEATARKYVMQKYNLTGSQLRYLLSINTDYRTDNPDREQYICLVDQENSIDRV